MYERISEVGGMHFLKITCFIARMAILFSHCFLRPSQELYLIIGDTNITKAVL